MLVCVQNSSKFVTNSSNHILFYVAILLTQGGRKVPECGAWSVGEGYTPSIAFRHLPPNSARFGYATEGPFFISAQLSTDAVSALRKVWVLIKLHALVYDILPWRKVPESDARSVGTDKTVEAT